MDLKRTGSDYRGACPFHGGTHRNFAVIPKKGMFYCFVCHEAGDVFSFFMKRFGMDYPTAVREVARKVGIVIPERSERQGPDPHEPLYAAAAVAQDWFARQLRESPEAERRADVPGRTGASRSRWRRSSGWATPRGAGSSRPRWRELGVKEDVLVEAGLVVRREDGSRRAPVPRPAALPDPRPARPRGGVRRAASSGRGAEVPQLARDADLPQGHARSTTCTSRGTPSAGRRARLVVEGYFDVIRLVQAGIEHVVAPLGTALTGDQAELLKRYTKTVTLLYDSDAAGLRATFRAGDELLRHDVRVRVATLPAGRGSRHAGPEGRGRGAPAGPARRGGRARAEDPDPRAEGVVRGRGAPAGGARPAAAHHPRRAPTPITRELYLEPRGGAHRA